MTQNARKQITYLSIHFQIFGNLEFTPIVFNNIDHIECDFTSFMGSVEAEVISSDSQSAFRVGSGDRTSSS